MIWRIIKKLLSLVQITIHYVDGDMIKIRILYGGKVLLDKEYDVIPD